MLAAPEKIKAKAVSDYGNTLQWSRGQCRIVRTGEKAPTGHKMPEPTPAYKRAEKGRTKYSDDFVLNICDEYERSGMTVIDFSKKKKINQGTFFGWLSPIGRRASILARRRNL